jgi:translation initiation factor 4A
MSSIDQTNSLAAAAGGAGAAAADEEFNQAAAAGITTTDSTPLKIYDSFDKMDLPDDIARGVYSYGFETPSSIQSIAIVPMMTGRDILAQSQSGTGKTGTFVIGSLSCIDPKIHAPQVLVLSPVRELAQQTEKVAAAIGSYMGLKTLAAVGGTQVRMDIAALRGGAQFITGTPGRIYDLIRRGDLALDNMKYIILDEADQMLEDLFQEQVKCILGFKFPASTHIALFSATMSTEVVEIADRFLQDPVKILLPADKVTLQGIKQFYVEVEREDWKFDVLTDIYQHLHINQALIYVNKRQKAEWLAKKMSDAGFTLECIHGEMDVAERKKRMQDFRAGGVRVLISTDLLARGIDVQQVSIVINYELPMQRENYIHRIGRSGRFARKGVAINLLTKDEIAMKEDIEKSYSTKIVELPEDLASISK